jgi:TonB family protein
VEGRLKTTPIPLILLAAVALGGTFLAGPVELPRFRSGAPPTVPAHAVGWGDVRLEAVVSDGGSVGGIRTLRASPPFTDALRNAVAGWRFDPARTKAGPVEAHVLVAGLFRPRVLYDTPAPGRPPADVAAPSARIPAPVDIPTPAYPARAIGDGFVIMEVLVGEDGAVREARVAASSGTGFEASARRAASNARFRPARRDGAPAPGRAYLVFGFRQPVAGPGGQP